MRPGKTFLGIAFAICTLCLVDTQAFAQQCKVNPNLIEKLEKTIVFIKADYRALVPTPVETNPDEMIEPGKVVSPNPWEHTFFIATGAFITPDGKILTSDHVVTPSQFIIGHKGKFYLYAVTVFYGGTSYKASVIARDPTARIALIKVISKPTIHFPTIVLGDFSKLKVDDCVFTVSNPFGQRNWFKKGVIANVERSLNQQTFQELSSYAVKFIKTNMSSTGGDSGGPLFNNKGQVVGIHDSAFIGYNMGFSVAIDDIVGNSITAFLSGKTITRFVFHSDFVDMSILDAISTMVYQKEFRAKYGINEATNQGVLLINNRELGFRDGDIIIALNGRKLHDLGDFLHILATLPVTQSVQVTVLRNGDSFSLYTLLSTEKIVPNAN